MDKYSEAALTGGRQLPITQLLQLWSTELLALTATSGKSRVQSCASLECHSTLVACVLHRCQDRGSWSAEGLQCGKRDVLLPQQCGSYP